MKNIFSILSADDDGNSDFDPTMITELSIEKPKENVQKFIRNKERNEHVNNSEIIFQNRRNSSNPRNPRNSSKFVPNETFEYKNALLKSNNACNVIDNQKREHKPYNKLIKLDKNTRFDRPVKRVLCKNVIEGNGCNYRLTCLYAHDLDEQKIDQHRQNAIRILKNNTIDNNGIVDSDMQTVFLLYTKTCPQCIINKCVGGYNCKYGAPINDLVVCADDILEECSDKHCNKIHLRCNGFVFNEEQQKINEEFLIEKTVDVSDIEETQSLQSLQSFNSRVQENNSSNNELNKDITFIIGNSERVEDQIYNPNFLDPVADISPSHRGNAIALSNRGNAVTSNSFENKQEEFPPLQSKNNVLCGKRPESQSDVIDKLSMGIIISNNTRYHSENSKEKLSEFYGINKEEEDWNIV